MKSLTMVSDRKIFFHCDSEGLDNSFEESIRYLDGNFCDYYTEYEILGEVS